MITKSRRNISEINRNVFYQMPKFLFDSEYKELSNDSKILYMLLLYRNDLSIQNNWIDQNCDTYVIFTRLEMCELLNMSDGTIRKSITQLKKLKLIKETKQGLGMPNLIYLLDPQK